MQAVLRDVTAIVDGAVLAGTASLRIEGTKVTAISSDLLAPREGEAVIEGKGKLAIPGLINAHTHLPMVLFRGLADELRFEEWWRERIRPIEETLRPEDVYWGSLLGLAEMIRSGTTALADMYFHTDAIGEAVEEAGVRAVLSYGVVASDLDLRGEEELRRAEAVLARWNGKGEGRIRGAVSPHAVFTCGEAVWREAIELAREHDVLLHTHLAETRDEVEWCRKERGATPAKYLDRIGAFTVPTLAAHCVHLDEDEIRLLADRDVTAVHCPKSNAKLGAGIAPVESMRRAGVRVALGTDGAAANNRLDMVEEMRMAALLQKGAREDASALPAREAFWMATRAGGRASGSVAGPSQWGVRRTLS